MPKSDSLAVARDVVIIGATAFNCWLLWRVLGQIVRLVEIVALGR